MNTSCNYCTKDTGTIQVFIIAILILFYCDVFHNFLISDNNKFLKSMLCLQGSQNTSFFFLFSYLSDYSKYNSA